MKTRMKKVLIWIAAVLIALIAVAVGRFAG